jgi:hypothetical protein
VGVTIIHTVDSALEGLVADLAAEMAHTAFLVELAAHGLLVVAEEAGEDGGEGLSLEGLLTGVAAGVAHVAVPSFSLGPWPPSCVYPRELIRNCKHRAVACSLPFCADVMVCMLWLENRVANTVNL